VMPFSSADWVFEMKFDGRRAFAAKRGDTVEIRDETGNDLTAGFAELGRDLAQIRAENALIDGILVALDDSKRPSRDKLGERLEGKSAAPVYFYALDLLYYDDWDLRAIPLLDRKQALASIIPALPFVLHVDHVAARGEELVEVASAAALKAVIAKEASSPYESGPSRHWRRIETRPAPGAEKVDLMDALSRAEPRATPGDSRRKIKFTNLEKVFWSREGYTKGDLIAYYDQVADVLVPYLRERPMHMNRYPDGIEGKNFYQKDAPDHTPDWVETELIPSDSRGESIRYIVCNNRETLLWLANLGSIDLHPWFSRRTSQDSPDWAVLDLDPDGSPFPQVVRVARELGKLLRGIGLRPYLKTSGATGLHIFVPLRPGYTYEQSRQFCEVVARMVAAELRDIATVDRVVGRRGGRVYIDFLQNRRGQTVVPVYAARPVPGAAASTPLDWDELSTELDPVAFNIKTVPQRIARLGDLFRPTLTDVQDLAPAIDALGELYQK